MNWMNLLIGLQTAVAETAETAAETTEELSTAGNIVSILVSLLPMVAIFVIFYFMLIRPQKKKDKAVRDMLNNLKVGDRICTIGGIYGTIRGIKDDTFTLAVGKDDLSMVVARWAIKNVESVSIENDAEALN